MGVKGGPDIITDGLVFHLDAAAKNKSYPVDGLDVEYLVVAGGGGGGGVIGGGGGAGGLLHGSTTASIATGTYSVVIGAGGAGGTGWNTSGQDGKVGGNSSVLGITANGGGGGAHHGGATSSTTINGGSGGGGANGSYNGGTGVSGQGNNGGNNGNGDLGSGGGGAGGVGGNAGNAFVVNSQGGAGGIGKYFGAKFGDVGYNGWFADGGGGGVRSYRGPYIPGVGRHGAGNGGFNSNDANVNGNGSANTGSGGGGGGYNTGWSTRSAGNGGSGIVIIKYKGAQKATGGDSIISRKGFTIHVFTSSGNFVVGDRVGGTSTNKIVGELKNMGSSSFKTNNKGYWSFDGSNQYIETDKTAGQLGISSAGGKFSIDIWYRDNSDGSSSKGLFTSFRGYNAYIGLNAVSNYRFGVVVKDNNGDQASFTTSLENSYAVGEYVYGTLVWDGSTKTIYCYLNGNLQGSDTDTLVDNIFEYANDPIKFRIGASSVPNWIYGPTPFEGDIASVRIYDNIALSAEQILDNYNATKGRFGL